MMVNLAEHSRTAVYSGQRVTGPRLRVAAIRVGVHQKQVYVVHLMISLVDKVEIIIMHVGMSGMTALRTAITAMVVPILLLLLAAKC